MAMRYCESLDEASLHKFLDAWRREGCDDGLLVLLPEAEKGQVGVIQAACRKWGIPLVGAIFPALVAGGEFCSRGAVFLRLDPGSHVALIGDLNQGEAPDEKIVNALGDRLGMQGTLFLIFDAMVPNIGTILDGLYLRLANHFRYMGVNAGSETFQPMPCLFDSERMVDNGVLAMLLPQHAGAVLEHGYKAPEQMIMATVTEGNRIVTIDWRPAFEVYRELVKSQYGVEVNSDNFYQYASHFPFGILRASEIVVRIPVALQQDGSLFCVGEVPPNSMLQLLRAPEVSSSETIETLARGLTAINGPMVGRDLLAFYCAGRRMHLGERSTDELKGLARRTGAGRMLGALSLGEIGSSLEWGYPLFHNATVVCSSWGAP